MNIKEILRNGISIYDLPLRVCYYARVSTDHEEQVSSIVNQKDYFVKYISGVDKWDLVNGYIDEGISGKAIYKRENFINMINDAKKGKFDLILTKSVSRFARNTMDSIYYTNLLLDINVGVFFINDNINTFYSDSEFRLTLMASIAQDELRKLSESVKFGLRQSINRGVVLGNNNILGYCKDRGRLVIVEDEAIIVREIFGLFLNYTNNYSKISRIINKKYNKRFNSTSIKRILTNYKYKGYYCGKKSEVIDYKKNNRKTLLEKDWVIYKDNLVVPSIVNELVWNKVNDIIKNKKNYNVDIYRDKVYCIKHGRVLSKSKIYKNKKYYYYICNNCFRISSKLIDRIVKDNMVDKIVVNNDNVLILDVFYNKEKHIISS